MALACATFVLAAAAPAGAQWRPIVRSCASQGAAAGCTAVANGFNGAWTVGVTPDGKHAYAAAWVDGGGAVHVFDRNATTGALAWKACYAGTAAPVAGCTTVNGIARPDGIVISANGLNVYVTGWRNGLNTAPASITSFTRAPATGLLTQTACINDDATGCGNGTTVGGHGAVLSRDQKSIYVLGTSSLAVFDRNTATGALTQSACYGTGPEVCTALPGNPGDPGGRQLVLSPDDKYLYVPMASGGVLIFQRDPATGVISLLPGAQGCIKPAATPVCSGRPALTTFTPGTLLSPDGKQLYVPTSNGIAVFARNATNGLLTFQSCVNDTGTLGCANGYNVFGIYYAAISPDGQDLVANHGGGAGGLSTLVRNTATGNLAARSGVDSCITRNGAAYDNGAFVTGGCRMSASVGGQGTVQFYGNRDFYAGGWPDGRISAYKRDFYPVCQSRNVTVPRNTAATIPLTCSDRNGDAVTRSIVQAPAAGTLGAINQAGQTVFYDPFSGFSGADRFTFRATAAGLTSATAAINVTVPAPPPRKLRRLRVGVSFSYDAYSDRTVLKKLQVKGVPRGSRLRARCVYRGRKCAGKASKAFLKKRARGRVSLAKRFVGVDLRIGARITVTVTKPNMIGAVKILTMRPRKEPKVTTRCLPPGARRAARC